MEEALLALLLASSGVTALVSGRVDWGVRPQGSALPAVALHLISGGRDLTLDGPGHREARVQVDCWASDFGGAVTLGRAVETALSGHRDTNFQAVLLLNEGSDSEDGIPGAGRLFRRRLDFFVRFTPT